MVIGSFGVFGTNIENQKDVIDESIVETQTVISGYRVNDIDKIGTVGKYTRTLSENNDLGVEILSKRTPTDRFFKNDDGTITAYLSITPNCYQDEEGIWHDGSAPLECSSITTLDSWEDNSNLYGYVYHVHGDEWDQDEVNTYGCNVYDSGRNHILIGQHYDEYIGGFWKKYSRGFAQWDISSISDYVDGVNSVDLSFYVSDDEDTLYHTKGDINHRQYADLKIYPMVEPISYYVNNEKYEELMDKCDEGVCYLDNPIRVKRSEPGVKTVSLNACLGLESRISRGQDWFGVCFDDTNEKECSEEDAGGILLDGVDTPSDGALVLKIDLFFDVGDVAIFIAGGIGDHQNYDPLDDAFYNTAKTGQRIFEDELGYGDARVKLLRKPDGRGSDKNGKEEIKSALNDLASEMCNANNVFVYLCDHGVGNPYVGDSWWANRFGADWLSHEGKFCLNPDGELLSWNQLAKILDDFYDQPKALGGKGYGTATIVVESCFSGHFVTENSGAIYNIHKSKGDKNHIIISATGPDHYSWGYTGEDGYSIFSNYFFDELSDATTAYGEAWENADKRIAGWVARNAKYIARELEKNNRIFNIFNNKFSNMPLIKIISSINRLLRNSLTVDTKEKILSPQFVPFDESDEFDEQKLIRNEKEMSTQCPLLTDNGIGAGNYAGTTSLNVPDNLDNANSENDDGWLALHTYPCKT